MRTAAKPYLGVWDVQGEPVTGSSKGLGLVRLTIALDHEDSVVGRADYEANCSNTLNTYNFEGRSLWLAEATARDCPSHGPLHFQITNDPRVLGLQIGDLALVARRVGA